MFHWGDIRILYLREIRAALRERNIVVNSILLPIFLYPLILWLVWTGIVFVSGQTEGFVSRMMLSNIPADAREMRQSLEKDKLVELRTSRDPVADIRDGKLDLLAEFSPAGGEASALRGNFDVRLTYDSSKDRSVIARQRFTEALGKYRSRYLAREAVDLGITPGQLQEFWIDDENSATSRQMGQFLLSRMLPMFMIIMLGVGCLYPAIDCTAGEREKSTWETLMTVATSRRNIVAAKYLYMSTMATMAAVLNLAAMLLSMKAVIAPLLGDRERDFSFQIPILSIPVILLITILLALFVAAGMMILASFARTFREGQSMVSPFYIGLLLPALLLQGPAPEFTPGLALVPVVNVLLVFRQAISGIFHWHLIAITIVSELACVSLSLWLAATILRYEDFIMGSFGGSFARFVKTRLLRKKRNEVALS